MRHQGHAGRLGADVVQRDSDAGGSSPPDCLEQLPRMGGDLAFGDFEHQPPAAFPFVPPVLKCRRTRLGQ
jgi:hypothetical protein